MSHSGHWDTIIGVIRAQVQQDTFDRWFGDCKLKNDSATDLTIEVPSIFYRNWVIDHFGPFIQSKLRELAGPDARFAIEIAGDNGSTIVAAPKRRRSRGASESPPSPRGNSNNGSHLNPKYTFVNFIEAPCNSFARATSLAAAQTPGRLYNPIFIYGGVGLGKTHLMQAIGHYMLLHLQGVRIHYVSSETFTNHLIHSVQNQKMDQFRRSYRDVNALLIDDIQFLSGKERTQEEFFHTFNALFDLRSQIVISSDRPPTELANMEERLMSRFQSGVVADLQAPDLETRAAILLNNAPLLRIKLPEDVAFFIAEKIRCNIRELEGALIRVASYASVTKQPLTVALAQHVLKDVLLHQDTRTITIDAIQKKVAERFDIRVADMKSPRRPKTIAYPRQVAMSLCRELTSHSLQEIGEAFGGRNHATVIHAHNLIARKLPSEPKLRDIIERLKEELSRGS